ncbi:serine/threonine-protein phosphatase 6 regulatory subunit 2-like isoform X2 [Paramormyrops kingsleyae]|uniref:serine/threonine-protein phosphatase 6 regulatory subunit 2-like isoform X2 n=1 Tax=Paramormyrops kingsleyae TaxID=1676925 RepID=UPI003B978F3B
MFWKFDLHNTSNVDKLLDKDDVTLHELMDEDDVLQECKAQNRRLLTFLSQDSCMQEMVALITREPPLDLEEKLRFRYPNVACELLTSDVSPINDKLGADESLLEKLYGFLEQEPPLNPLLASFFSKIFGNLIARKTEQVIAFLRKKEGFVSLLLKHIDTSAMMDLLLRLVSCVDPATLRLEVLNWLNGENLIERLVGLVHSEEDEERQSNASQTLCDIIRLSRDGSVSLQEQIEPAQTDPLLTKLEAQQTVEKLLQNMFSGERSEVCIVSGTQVLLTLLETRRPGIEGLMDLCSQGYERSHTVNSSVLQGIEPHLKDFHQVLLDPPKKCAMLTSLGVLEEPLGNARLHVAHLVAALLQSCTPGVAAELCRLNTVDLLLDLFFKYTWNNFLHFQVELCVTVIMNQPSQEENPERSLGSKEPPETLDSSTHQPNTPQPHVLVTHLFQTCHLVQRILDAWEENDKIQADGGMRRGYMGHLTRIANSVVQNTEKGPAQVQISDIIKDLPEDCRGRWERFVDETLAETNRRNTADLVSTHNLHSSSEDDDLEGPFPNEMSLQQAFSDYQIQQMTANFVDQFGFNDEEFAEHDDNINATFDRIAEINFSLDVDDDTANVTMFEACCKERIRPFDDAEEDEEDEDIWEEGQVDYAAQVKKRSRFGVSHITKGDVANGEEGKESRTGGAHAENHKNRVHGQDSEMDSPETGPGWTASFEDLLTSKAPLSRAAVEMESGTWEAASPQPGADDKGWARFTDLRSFQRSECQPSAEGSPKHDADTSRATCTWAIGSNLKAPLVASDSSSSGSSDSEEDDEEDEEAEKKAVSVMETSVMETVTGGTGTESIAEGAAKESGAGKETVTGGAAKETVTGGAAKETVTGGAAKETVTGGSAKETVTGGSAKETVTGGAAKETVTGGAAKETVTGGAAKETVTGGAAKETVTGGAAKETVTGGAAKETVTGGAAKETVTGGAAKETVTGGAAKETVTGGSAKETVTGGAAKETVTGGAAKESGVSKETVTGGAAKETVTGGAAKETVTGGAGTESIAEGAAKESGISKETVTGGAAKEAVTGGAAKEAVTGGAAKEAVTGGAGKATVTGGAGKATVTGGAAKATVTGGAAKATVKLTTDTKKEKPVFISAEVASIPLDKLTVADGPPEPAENPERTDPTGIQWHGTVTDLTVTDRREEVPPSAEAAVNGPA